MNYLIKFIPQSEQRYATLGDYQTTGDLCEIRVSTQPNSVFSMAIALHELVETYLCRLAGITDDEIDKWDLSWKSSEEPGDDPNCPYYQQHQFATKIERQFIESLGYDWKLYIEATNSTLDEVSDAE